jgi:hypothetical protein
MKRPQIDADCAELSSEVFRSWKSAGIEGARNLRRKNLCCSSARPHAEPEVMAEGVGLSMLSHRSAKLELPLAITMRWRA